MAERASPDVTTHVVVSNDDTDELGHVSNLVYLRWVLEAAIEHSRRAGYGDHAAFRRHGAVFVVRRHEIDYLVPAFAGDELALVTWIEGWKAATSVRRVSIRRRRDDVELAHAATTWAFVSTEDGRPRRIPEELRAAYAAVAT